MTLKDMPRERSQAQSVHAARSHSCEPEGKAGVIYGERKQTGKGASEGRTGTFRGDENVLCLDCSGYTCAYTCQNYGTVHFKR